MALNEEDIKKVENIYNELCSISIEDKTYLTESHNNKLSFLLSSKTAISKLAELYISVEFNFTALAKILKISPNSLYILQENKDFMKEVSKIYDELRGKALLVLNKELDNGNAKVAMFVLEKLDNKFNQLSGKENINQVQIIYSPQTNKLEEKRPYIPVPPKEITEIMNNNNESTNEDDYDENNNNYIVEIL